MANGPRWTQTAIDDLRAGLRDIMAVEDIAAALGRTVGDVEGMMRRMRMRVQRPSSQK
jgi:hypothetical protein